VAAVRPAEAAAGRGRLGAEGLGDVPERGLGARVVVAAQQHAQVQRRRPVGLLLIDYLFHPTLMVSALVLGWSLLTLPPAAASGSPVSAAGKSR
jgi:hypothetical protein